MWIDLTRPLVSIAFVDIILAGWRRVMQFLTNTYIFEKSHDLINHKNVFVQYRKIRIQSSSG